MNYDEMSTQELNIALTEKLGIDAQIREHQVNKDAVMVLDQSLPYIRWIEKDLINDWSVMGPIIEGHQIDIEWPRLFSVGENDGVCSMWKKDLMLSASSFKKGGNALRAAAICYLLSGDE